jgi:sigma-70-like protein
MSSFRKGRPRCVSTVFSVTNSDEGMTMREIAESKDLPIGTIKSRAWYAMRSLRLALKETEAATA